MSEPERPAPGDILAELQERFGPAIVARQETGDGMPTLWATPAAFRDVLRHLKTGIPQPYRTVYDLTAVDERSRTQRAGQPDSDFTVVYTLRSYERNAEVRVKVALQGDYPVLPTITDLWPAADWYEREVWDMFGITFEGHPNLRRILMPPYWKGHPLRKEHPARATEMPPYQLTEAKKEAELELLQFVPEEWGLERRGTDGEFMFVNIGPHHPGTHGMLRIILQLDGEEIVNAVPDIGFHHRGAEKMGERQTWHSYIPYTDRVDYLSGVVNNLAYLTSLEKLAGIDVPDRAQVIRVMLAELYRLASHLVWYGTFAQDVGQMSPVFYMFTDRERVFDIAEAITGGRMHPGWFRIGGVAADLPEGWEEMVRSFLDYMPGRLREYDKLVMANAIFKKRTVGIGRYSLDQAMEWGATGPGLRACGLAWDLRKVRPYSGYEQFEFEIPTAANGDCYDRGVVRVEEMRQSLRIIRQCLEQMPPGPYKSTHPLTTPPLKPRTMHDIETLIHHFLRVSWGPVVPAGEAMVPTEATKGDNGYYLISDGGDQSYRTRIRTPSFAHLQMIPLLSRGLTVADLIAILGSLDFVLADVDR